MADQPIQRGLGILEQGLSPEAVIFGSLYDEEKPSFVEMVLDREGVISITDNRINFRVANNMEAKFLEERIREREVYRRAIEELGMRDPQIEVQEDEEMKRMMEEASKQSRKEQEEQITKTRRAKPKNPKKVLGAPLDETFKFENFYIGEHNRQQVALVRMLEENLPLFPHLYLAGETGTGKSALAQAFAHKRNSHCYYEGDQFSLVMRDAIGEENRSYDKERAALMKRAVEAEVFILDDVEGATGKATGEALAHIINQRSRRPTIVTGKVWPRFLPVIDGKSRKSGIEKSFRSRLCQMTEVGMRLPNYPEITEIVKEILITQYGEKIRIGKNTPGAIATEAIQRARADGRKYPDYREIIGVAATSAAYAISYGFENLTEEAVRESLGEISAPTTPGENSSLDKILDTYSEIYHIPRTEITTNRKNGLKAVHRGVISYVAKELHPETPWRVIGELTGRTHATAIAAHRRAATALDTNDPLYTERVNTLIEKLSQK